MQSRSKREKVWRTETRLPEKLGHIIIALANEGRRSANQQIRFMLEGYLERTTQRAK